MPTNDDETETRFLEREIITLLVMLTVDQTLTDSGRARAHEELAACLERLRNISSNPS